MQGEPIGELQTFYELDVRMLTCRTCGRSWYESFSFLPRPQARITKAFARLLLKFRESMSITDVARDLGVDAKMGLLEWCSSARASEIPETIQMAKTVERHLSGILG